MVPRGGGSGGTQELRLGLGSGLTFCVDEPPMDIKRGAGAPAGGITRALRLLTVAVIVVPVILFATAA